ncbi:hypothetical protein [Nonomuraea sp. NPDC050783]|uniref:hypothetical protein n=1 Tax=Nonomuraea sp. NPDC050783 TaxID=3154634 RepID=UPI003466047E
MYADESGSAAYSKNGKPPVLHTAHVVILWRFMWGFYDDEGDHGRRMTAMIGREVSHDPQGQHLGLISK